jgi:hypothetical protein
MEQLVARWQRPVAVASGVALDMLHWAMLHVSLQRLCTAIEMACHGDIFACCRHFLHDTTHS